MQCLGLTLTATCAACNHCSATAWEWSRLDHSDAATPQRVTRAPCAQLLRSVLGRWCRLPLICLRLELLVGVCLCVRDGLAASVCVYVALLLLPLSFFLGVGAPSLSLAGFMFKAIRRGCSLPLDHSHCSLLLRRLVSTRQACCLFVHVALLLLPLSLFLGVRAPSLSHGRFMNSKLLDVAH